jgi:hypothetical protein
LIGAIDASALLAMRARWQDATRWSNGLPDESVVIGSNGPGDLLLADDDHPHWWDHESAGARHARSRRFSFGDPILRPSD